MNLAQPNCKLFLNSLGLYVIYQTSIVLWQVEHSAAQWLTGTMTIWSSCWPWGTLEWERPPSSTGIPTISSTASSQPQWVLTSEKREWWVTLNVMFCLACRTYVTICNSVVQGLGGLSFFVLRFRCTQGQVLMGRLRGTSESTFSFGTRQDKRGKSCSNISGSYNSEW